MSSAAPPHYLVLTHFRQVSLPKPAPKEVGEALNFTKAEDFRQSKIDCGRVGLYPQKVRGLVK